MTRMPQLVLVASALACSWLLMQAVHELGHVLAAWATGGTVQEFVLHPLTISHTDIAPNPAPLTVVWAGPLVGVAIPLALAAIAKLAHSRAQRYANFFAGFCLIANGAYLAVGAFTLDGDPAEMLQRLAALAHRRLRQRSVRRRPLDLASHERRIRLRLQAKKGGAARSAGRARNRRRAYANPGDHRPSLTSAFACSNTSSSIRSVNTPVLVFCRLG